MPQVHDMSRRVEASFERETVLCLGGRIITRVRRPSALQAYAARGLHAGRSCRLSGAACAGAPLVGTPVSIALIN